MVPVELPVIFVMVSGYFVLPHVIRLEGIEPTRPCISEIKKVSLSLSIGSAVARLSSL